MCNIINENNHYSTSNVCKNEMFCPSTTGGVGIRTDCFLYHWENGRVRAPVYCYLLQMSSCRGFIYYLLFFFIQISSSFGGINTTICDNVLLITDIAKFQVFNVSCRANRREKNARTSYRSYETCIRMLDVYRK